MLPFWISCLFFLLVNLWRYPSQPGLVSPTKNNIHSRALAVSSLQRPSFHPQKSSRWHHVQRGVFIVQSTAFYLRIAEMLSNKSWKYIYHPTQRKLQPLNHIGLPSKSRNPFSILRHFYRHQKKFKKKTQSTLGPVKGFASSSNSLGSSGSGSLAFSSCRGSTESDPQTTEMTSVSKIGIPKSFWRCENDSLFERNPNSLFEYTLILRHR